MNEKQKKHFFEQQTAGLFIWKPGNSRTAYLETWEQIVYTGIVT